MSIMRRLLLMINHYNLKTMLNDKIEYIGFVKFFISMYLNKKTNAKIKHENDEWKHIMMNICF